MSVLFLLYFFPLDQLFDPPRAQQHDVRRGGECDDVDDQAEGERNDALNDGVDGQGTLKVGADEEHIEGFVAEDSAVEHDFVEDHGDADGRGEHRQGAQNGLVLRPHVA